jgi:hypothetical protein
MFWGRDGSAGLDCAMAAGAAASRAKQAISSLKPQIIRARGCLILNWKISSIRETIKNQWILSDKGF